MQQWEIECRYRARAGRTILRGTHLVEVILGLARVAEADVDEGQHGGRQLVAVGELEGEGRLVCHGLCEALRHHLVNDLLLRLRLQRRRGGGTVRSCSDTCSVL